MAAAMKLEEHMKKRFWYSNEIPTSIPPPIIKVKQVHGVTNVNTVRRRVDKSKMATINREWIWNTGYLSL